MKMNQLQYENFKLIKSIINPFWLEVYKENQFIVSYLISKLILEKQNIININELFDGICYLNIPESHYEEFWVLKLNKNKKISVPKNYYGSSIVYGQNFNYGEVDNELAAYPGPVDLIKVPIIADGLTKLNKTWIHGIHFNWDNDKKIIIFNKDPFLLEENKNKTDINLFLFNAKFNKNNIETQLGGYFLNVDVDNSIKAKLIKLITESQIYGNAEIYVKKFLSLISGIPCSEEDEIVEKIIYTNYDTQVITDKNVYTAALNTQINVTEGQKIKPGHFIFKGIDILIPPVEKEQIQDIPEFTIDKKKFPFLAYSNISFPNQDTDLIKQGVVNGKLFVKFNLIGNSIDIDNLFNHWHNFGVSRKTIAEILNQRETVSDNPFALLLPEKINPMLFLINTVLAKNLLLIKIKPTLWPTTKYKKYIHFIEEFLPPSIQVKIYEV